MTIPANEKVDLNIILTLIEILKDMLEDYMRHKVGENYKKINGDQRKKVRNNIHGIYIFVKYICSILLYVINTYV